MRSPARLAPSAAHRWMNCLGSARLEAGLPEVNSEYAIEGAAAHQIAARLIEKRSRFESEEKVLSFLSGVGGARVVTTSGASTWVPMNDEMREAIALYARVVREELARDPGAELLVERPVFLRGMNPPPGLLKADGSSGTADAIIVSSEGPPRVTVLDLKFGRGIVVDVVENPQMMIYAAAALSEFFPGDMRASAETIIVQPRAWHPDGPVRRSQDSAVTLAAWIERALHRAALTESLTAPLTPGPWCQFCKAAAYCPALKTATQEAAQMEFTMPETESVSVVKIDAFQQPVEAVYEPLPPDPERLPLAVAAAILQKAEIAEAFIRAVRARVKRELEAGRPVSGWKLVAGQARRYWRNEDDVEAWGRAAGLTREELFETSVRSPAGIERIIGKGNLPTELVEKRGGAVHIVPETDPRPALPGTAQQEFSALPSGTDSYLTTDGERGSP